jgi:SAM-dependent MidA family methyltransferase
LVVARKTGLAQLPEPKLEEKSLSHQLVRSIKRQLLHDAGLSFAEFMSSALYTPELGYYANGRMKFGAQGDFVTAPELSPLFGQCVARQAAEIFAQLKNPSLLELGAGSGALAESVLLTLAKMNQLPESYLILEPSSALQQQQRERLEQKLPRDLLVRVQWLTTLPQNFVGVVVGNEVADALPVEVLRLWPKDAEQAYVCWDETQQSFDWQWRHIVDADLQALANKVRTSVGEVSAQGYQVEVCLLLRPWLQSLSDSLQQGAVLLIDYGYVQREYWSASRWMGSLRAHYRQRAHNNPFYYPGLQDLTAHVDFTALAHAGHAAGLSVAGFTTQSHFLLSLGITGMIDENADVMRHLQQAQQIKTLTMPDEMGENFKVMAFMKGLDLPLSGFVLRDMRTSL